jgi:hypothetical protein
MKSVQDVYISIRQRLLHECEGLRNGRNEMESLAAQYHRYRDLQAGVEAHWKRILYILRLIGPDRAAKIMGLDKTGILLEVKDNPPQSDDAHAELPVWMAIREYLREAGEARVGEIQSFLAWLGFESVSRQAIESALKRHEGTFRVRTKGHQRIVSLRD